MSYILPIPQYQYIGYRERVFNEADDGYSNVDSTSKVTFDKVLQERTEPEMSSEERRKKRENEHEAFRVHLAQISGKGFEIDELG
ncbi:hypothetical protein [Domibacillus epiphyticus]|uniref:Uncharacterized protein n=1 Tax=Domibacillus epiphyticus TaxID=1714355 RepID=A0A1V2A7U6_9BACI|nr:hypothetical protein [Domibacillus epiphyticus]OMP67075.1 hypothetical protein BTO28_08825 [Domibacillus epiphyticus]